MLNGKDFVSRNLFGERFDKNVYRNGYDIRHATKGLTPSGKDIQSIWGHDKTHPNKEGFHKNIKTYPYR